MSSCERCWKEANGNADRYHELLAINRCSPEEQAGENATECPRCDADGARRKMMSQFSIDELHEILDLHGKWLRSIDGGKRASLSGAYLSGAVLSGANLSGADLRGADLLPDLYLLKFQPVNTKLRAWKFLHRGGTSPYQNHPYEVGKSYSTSDFSTDERGACDKGLNVATLQWCLRNSDAEDNVFIEVEFRAGDIVAVPFATDGKFRVKKLRVVRSISKAKARKIVEEAVSPLGVKQGGKEE